MSDSEIRNHLKDIGIIFQFHRWNKFLDYTKSVDRQKTIYQLPNILNFTYAGWKDNTHHLKTGYHINYTYPLVLKQLNINFNINDFEIVKRFSQDNLYDLKYLKPTFCNPIYDITCYSLDEHFEDVDFEYLNHVHNKEVDSWALDYHRMYCYPHLCSKIVNKTLSNNRKLFISADSQTIPTVPIFSLYFEEVYYFDNRDGKNHIRNLDGVNITDCIFMTGFNDFSKYWVANLR